MSRYLAARRARLGLAVAGVIGVAVAAGFALGGPAISAATTAHRADATSSCGSNPGVAATGTPISLGTINTQQPGTDFSDISNMAAAYFACVNANGGVNGHPIQYHIEYDQSTPAQIAGEAKQLIQSDNVVGIVGVTDILECTVDEAYWKSVGIFEIDSGIAPECWSTPNSAAVNMGPRYSSDGAVEYAIEKGAKKIVFDQSNVPGTGYIAAGPAAVAKANHVKIVQLTEDVPITDASSVALKEVDDAGKNGAVILNYTPPEALLILQAAQKLGIEDRVKSWGCSPIPMAPPELSSRFTRRFWRSTGLPFPVESAASASSGSSRPSLPSRRSRRSRARTRSRASTQHSRGSRTTTRRCSASRGTMASCHSTFRTTRTTPRLRTTASWLWPKAAT